jgi:peptide/nickel transport system substrate-binding protein
VSHPPKSRRSWIATAVVTLFVASCAGTTSSTAPTGTGVSPAAPGTATEAPSAAPAKDSITLALKIDATSMDPYNAPDDLTGTSIDKLMYEGLVGQEVGADGKMTYPGLLATSWDQTAPQTWRFHLRSGVTFHDGSPFSADDVKFTFDRYSNEKATTGNSWSIGPWYDSITVVDPMTFDFSTKYAVPNLPAILAYAPEIISKTAVEKASQGDAAELSGPALVGTGPFKFVSWEKGVAVTMQRFDGYWGGPAKVGSIKIVPIADDQTRANALSSGQVDMISNIPINLADQLKTDPNISVNVTPSSVFTYMWLDMLKAPFNDVLVRQAANYAVDWGSITKTLFGGTATPADAPLAPADFGYHKQQAYTYLPDKAKQLLSQAGVTLPVKVVFWAPQNYLPQDTAVAQAVAGYMNQVGFQVDLQSQDWSSMSSRVFDQQNEILAGTRQAPDYDMVLISWSSTYLDADDAMYSNYRSGQQYNLAYYKNPQVDQLLDTARSEQVVQTRLDQYNQVEALIMADAPQLFGYYGSDIPAWNKKLQGVQVLPYSAYLLQKAFWTP